MSTKRVDEDQMALFGICQCGCGDTTSPSANRTSGNYYRFGEPLRWCRGHAPKRFGYSYVAPHLRWVRHA